MKATILRLVLGVSLFGLCNSAAMSDDRLVGNVSLSPVSSNCAGAAAGGAVEVKFVLPEAPSGAAPGNRFRYNYREAPAPRAAASAPVTITGEIHDYGVPGCTMSFAGLALRYD